MPKSREQKKKILEKISGCVERSKSMVFAKFDAFGVKDNEELRKKLKEQGSEYYVAKKTLLGLSLKDRKIEGFDIKKLDGKVAVIFGYEDEVAPAKVIDGMMKEKEGKIGFIGGVLEGKFISGSQVEALAKLPSKQELYAKMVGSLNAPISGFVNVMAGNLRSLVNVLKAIENKK